MKDPQGRLLHQLHMGRGSGRRDIVVDYETRSWSYQWSQSARTRYINSWYVRSSIGQYGEYHHRTPITSDQIYHISQTAKMSEWWFDSPWDKVCPLHQHCPCWRRKTLTSEGSHRIAARTWERSAYGERLWEIQGVIWQIEQQHQSWHCSSIYWGFYIGNITVVLLL